MKRAIMKEFDQLAETLSNYSAVFSYRLKNLCVKAEEVSLIPIQVMIEGEPQKLEECTTIGKEDEYSFMIFPNFDEDLQAVSTGIIIEHPEFKQEVKTMKVDSVDVNGNQEEKDVRYILVTMPEVDDNRYDVLKDGVKVCYEECKAQMDAANLKADVNFTRLSVGESEEDIEKVKAAREKLNETWDGQRDKIYNEKLQEIEDAHNKWLAEREEKEQKRQEDEATHSDTAARSMKIDQDDMAN